MTIYAKMKMRAAVLICAGLLVLALAVPAAGVIDTLPGFSLPSALDGKEVRSEDFKGKALLITFFTTWCPPCRQEIPSLIKLQEKYLDRGFSVIGLSMDKKGPRVVLKLIEKEKINYPILMSDSKIERDFGGIVGIPTTFLVDRQGRVVKRYPGYVRYQELEEAVRSIL